MEPAGDEDIDIDQVVRTNLRWIEPYAIRKGIGVEFSPLSGAPFLRCDRIQLRQTLLYLMRNAVKYNQPGGKIEIKTELSTQGLSIVLADTRQGILVDAMALELARKFTEKHGGELNTTWVPDQEYYVLRLLFPLARVRGVAFIPANDGVVLQEPTARPSPNSHRPDLDP